MNKIPWVYIVFSALGAWITYQLLKPAAAAGSTGAAGTSVNGVPIQGGLVQSGGVSTAGTVAQTLGETDAQASNMSAFNTAVANDTNSQLAGGPSTLGTINADGTPAYQNTLISPDGSSVGSDAITGADSDPSLYNAFVSGS